MSNKLEALKEKMANLRKEYVETAKVEFTELSKELFEKYPELKSFGWAQYTPYFNDGEECVFAARTDRETIYINGVNEWDDDELVEGALDLHKLAEDQEYKDGKFIPKAHDAKAKKIVSAVYKFLQSFDNDFLKEAFGDHVKVTVTADKTDIDDYQHD